MLKPKITREWLKAQTGDDSVFRFYFGDFELGANYKSVFRDEDHSSTGFYLNKKDSIIYNDFATGDKYDFVQFVMKLYGLNYYQALNQIAVDFNLIPGKRSTEKLAIINKVERKKKEKFLQVGVTKFKQRHLDFWAKFGITEEELLAHKVYAVNNLYINGYPIPTKPEELRFAFLFKDENDKEYIKVYSPYDLEYKWTSSVPLSLVFGLDSLSFETSELWIAKSVKDRIVLLKFFKDVVGFQNESKAACSDELARSFTKLYKKVYMWFDLDRTGIKAANYYRKNYGFIPVFYCDPRKNVWQNLIEVKAKKTKDPSDFVQRYTLAGFEKYLKYRKFI